MFANMLATGNVCLGLTLTLLATTPELVLQPNLISDLHTLDISQHGPVPHWWTIDLF